MHIISWRKTSRRRIRRENETASWQRLSMFSFVHCILLLKTSADNVTLNKMSIFRKLMRRKSHKIENEDYELYYADVDTTFCLVNNQFKKNPSNNLRIAGNFTAKHLPWYKDYITKNISKEELDHWKQNNISSSILKCLSLWNDETVWCPWLQKYQIYLKCFFLFTKIKRKWFHVPSIWAP